MRLPVLNRVGGGGDPNPRTHLGGLPIARGVPSLGRVPQGLAASVANASAAAAGAEAQAAGAWANTAQAWASVYQIGAQQVDKLAREYMQREALTQVIEAQGQLARDGTELFARVTGGGTMGAAQIPSGVNFQRDTSAVNADGRPEKVPRADVAMYEVGDQIWQNEITGIYQGIRDGLSNPFARREFEQRASSWVMNKSSRVFESLQKQRKDAQGFVLDNAIRAAQKSGNIDDALRLVHQGFVSTLFSREEAGQKIEGIMRDADRSRVRMAIATAMRNEDVALLDEVAIAVMTDPNLNMSEDDREALLDEVTQQRGNIHTRKEQKKDERNEENEAALMGAILSGRGWESTARREMMTGGLKPGTYRTLRSFAKTMRGGTASTKSNPELLAAFDARIASVMTDGNPTMEVADLRRTMLESFSGRDLTLKDLNSRLTLLGKAEDSRTHHRNLKEAKDNFALLVGGSTLESIALTPDVSPELVRGLQALNEMYKAGPASFDPVEAVNIVTERYSTAALRTGGEAIGRDYAQGIEDPAGRALAQHFPGDTKYTSDGAIDLTETVHSLNESLQSGAIDVVEYQMAFDQVYTLKMRQDTDALKAQGEMQEPPEPEPDPGTSWQVPEPLQKLGDVIMNTFE